MSKIESAIQFMEDTARDNSHGYCQTHRWGKDEIIAQQHAKHEHDISPDNDGHGKALLVSIKRRRDKAEEFIENIGRGAKHSGTKGCLHVDDKLFGKSCVNQLDDRIVGSTGVSGKKRENNKGLYEL